MEIVWKRINLETYQKARQALSGNMKVPLYLKVQVQGLKQTGSAGRSDARVTHKCQTVQVYFLMAELQPEPSLQVL